MQISARYQCFQVGQAGTIETCSALLNQTASRALRDSQTSFNQQIDHCHPRHESHLGNRRFWDPYQLARALKYSMRGILRCTRRVDAVR